jgi:hypothetical protein
MTNWVVTKEIIMIPEDLFGFELHVIYLSPCMQYKMGWYAHNLCQTLGSEMRFEGLFKERDIGN